MEEAEIKGRLKGCGRNGQKKVAPPTPPAPSSDSNLVLRLRLLPLYLPLSPYWLLSPPSQNLDLPTDISTIL